VARVVLLDEGARVHCCYAGASLFSESAGDTTAVTLLLSPELREQLRALVALPITRLVVEPQDASPFLLKALLYAGYLVAEE